MEIQSEKKMRKYSQWQPSTEPVLAFRTQGLAASKIPFLRRKFVYRMIPFVLRTSGIIAIENKKNKECDYEKIRTSGICMLSA